MTVPKVFLRSQYNFDGLEACLETSLRCLDESLTVQSQAEEADINVIMRRFGVTGAISHVTSLPPAWGDFEGVTDYHSALNLLMAAQDSFMELKADIRNKFDNDPGKFVDFCSNPDNIDAMREMGLAVPKAVEPSPQKVEIVNPPVKEVREVK